MSNQPTPRTGGVWDEKNEKLATHMNHLLTEDDQVSTTLGGLIDWSNVEVFVTGRLKSSWWKTRYRPSESPSTEVKINLEAYDKHFDEVAEKAGGPLRDALLQSMISAWLFESRGTSDTNSHGFKRAREKMDVDRYLPKSPADPKYKIICKKCGNVTGHRYQDCKITKQTHRFHHTNCGGSLRVERV